MNSDIVECVGWVSRVATICAGLRKYWWIALEQIVRGSTHPEEHELAEAPLLWENFSQKYSEVIFILWSQYWLIRVILKICSLQRKPDNCNANSSPFPHPPPQQHQASHRHTFQLDIILLPQIFPALVALQLKFGSICMLTVGSPSAGGCPVSGVTKWSSPVSPRIPISVCLHSHFTLSTSPITSFYYQANLCPSYRHWKKDCLRLYIHPSMHQMFCKHYLKLQPISICQSGTRVSAKLDTFDQFAIFSLCAIVRWYIYQRKLGAAKDYWSKSSKQFAPFCFGVVPDSLRWFQD